MQTRKKALIIAFLVLAFAVAGTMDYQDEKYEEQRHGY